MFAFARAVVIIVSARSVRAECRPACRRELSMYPTAAVATREHRMTAPVAGAGQCVFDSLFDKGQRISLRQRGGGRMR